MGVFDELKKVAKSKIQEAIPDQIVPTAQTLTPISAEQKLQEARTHYRLPREIEKLILKGVSCSKCVSELKKDPAFSDLSPKELNELCHTAMTRLFNEKKAKQMEDDFEYYQIVTADDYAVCPICKNANKMYKFSDRKIGVNFPPFHLGCRCTIRAVMGGRQQWIQNYEAKHSKSGKSASLHKNQLYTPKNAFLLEWQNLICEPSDKLYMSEKQLQDFSIDIGNRKLEILNDCARLMTTTTNIDTFFYRYDCYIDILKFLSKLERFVKMEGDSPSKKIQQISGKYDSLVIEFIDRYWEDTRQKAESLKTEKGRINRYKKFEESFEKYRNRLSESVLEYLKQKILNP